MRSATLLFSLTQLLGCLLGGGACAKGVTDAYGTFGVGNWPPASYRVYAGTAWINRSLPANPQTDPNSAAIVAQLNSHGSPEDKPAGALNDYDHPIYWSKASDPIYTLSGCGYSGALNGITIHALKGMVPGGGSDAHLAVMDQASNVEYDFWEATIDDNARTLGGTACGRLSIFGDGRVNGQTVNGPDGDGANAAITGLYAGQIRGAEIAAGKIQHGVAVAVTCTNGTFVYPATGRCISSRTRCSRRSATRTLLSPMPRRTWARTSTYLAACTITRSGRTSTGRASRSSSLVSSKAPAKAATGPRG